MYIYFYIFPGGISPFTWPVFFVSTTSHRGWVFPASSTRLDWSGRAPANSRVFIDCGRLLKLS